MNKSTTCKLYRHFDKEGKLLYVGVANNALARTGQHAQKCWADLVCRIEIQTFESRESALAAERTAIATENPIYNKSGTMSVICMAARDMYSQGLASHAELAELAGKSRQLIRHWVRDIPNVREAFLNAMWEEAGEAVEAGADKD